MKKVKIPSSMTIICMILLIVAVLTWIVPTSAVTINENTQQSTIIFNATIDDDGNIIKNAGKNPAGIWDIIYATIQGFYDAASISISIFVTGGFLAILNLTGALDAGIGCLLQRFKGRTLIAFLMLTFALMGTVYGSWEELPAYALIIVPLFVAAGYDVIVGILVLFIGAIIGNFSSIVNPFSVGAAISSMGNPELSLGSGIGLRATMFITMYIVGTYLVMRYADKVKSDPKKSAVYEIDDVKTYSDSQAGTMPQLTKKRKASLLIFLGMILIIACGYIPWNAIKLSDGRSMYEVINYPLDFFREKMPGIADLLGTNTVTRWGDWYFDEFSIVFIIGALIVGAINKIPEKEFVNAYIKGCEELFGCVLVLSIARGVTVLMGTNDAGISITFIYWLQSLLSNVPAWAFIIAAVATFMLVGIFIQSTSSVAGITMPILGALAAFMFAGTIGSSNGQVLLLSAFTLGINLMSIIYPSPTIMGAIQLVNVPYDRYLKITLKTVLPIMLTGIICIVCYSYIL